MFEILFLFISTGGIAAYARARGGNPYLWGTISVAGFLLIQFLGGLVLGTLGLPRRMASANPTRLFWIENAQLIVVVLSYAWVGGVALCTRFLIGRGGEKPSGMWSCPNCKYLNQHYAVVCEACQQPYSPNRKA
jgi:hypothetical protein